MQAMHAVHTDVEQLHDRLQGRLQEAEQMIKAIDIAQNCIY